MTEAAESRCCERGKRARVPYLFTSLKKASNRVDVVEKGENGEVRRMKEGRKMDGRMRQEDRRRDGKNK